MYKITGGNQGAVITLKSEIKNEIEYITVNMKLAEKAIPEMFTMTWKMPIIDCYSTWSPSIREGRCLGPDWGKQKTHSKLASWMPLHQILSVSGQNKLTIAVSDAMTPMAVGTGVCEEDAHLECVVEFFTLPTTAIEEYTAIVRIDRRDIPYYDSLYDASNWFEELSYEAAYVPDAARRPMNSAWYSFHQNIDVDAIVEECRLSRPYGMETIIIDDGWQTDDNNRGYAYCGDWEVTPNKIPDMKAFVDRVHETGMKMMIWYSVPFMGIYTKNYEKFRDMLLDESGNQKDFFALDPRYKEVREYLINIYETAVKEWGLDGLKLDFIDSFVLKGKSLQPDPRRDIESLEMAIDTMMSEITQRLTKLNPEILIEFRQSYIGPSIRKYGNMLRVGDCPNDAIYNRRDIVNLRYTSGKTAVHSDMLMWNPNEPVESAAMQVVSTLYSVPQISVRLKNLPEDHQKMLKFYLDFWNANRDVLLDGKLTAKNPESGYSLVVSSTEEKEIYTAYTDILIPVEKTETIAINASGRDTLLLKGAIGRKYEVIDCMGQKIDEGALTEAFEEIHVPMAGMLKVR